MVGWYHLFNGHELEHTLEYGEGQGTLPCHSPWGCKESDVAWPLNSNNKQRKARKRIYWHVAWIVFERWGFRAFGDKFWNGIQRPNSFYFLVLLPLCPSSSMMAICSLRDHILISSLLVEECCNCPLYSWQSLRFTLGLPNAICWHLFILELVWRCKTTRPWVDVKTVSFSSHSTFQL